MDKKENGEINSATNSAANSAVNVGTPTLVLVSLVFIIMGAVLNFFPVVDIEYIFMALCGAFVVTGIIAIVKYFMNDEYKKLGSYGFAAGCLLVILGICGMVRVDVISEYFLTIIGLAVVVTGVIALQSALDLERMKDSLWIFVLVIAVGIVGVGVFVLMAHDPSESFVWWLMIVDGVLNLLIVIYLAARLKSYVKKTEGLDDAGADSSAGPKVIIFDMDGTLIDTEKIYRKVWPETFKEFGYEMKDEEFLALRSMGRPYSIDYIRKHFGENAVKDYDRMRERRGEKFREYIEKNPITEKKNASKTLKRLKDKGYRLALATATDEKRTAEYLKSTGLDGYFEKIICATQVERGKPAPDVYLEACKRMGVKPGDAYAVEDGPNGLKAAADAGMKVMFVPDLTGPDSETEKYSNRTFKDIEDLGDYLCNTI
ncbi:MAG: HAD-IA family hydrolase [Lachnospiraceae bacterium]|nr:HAD-IA family hydrolase [Lachnospiraceae bacterium]